MPRKVEALLAILLTRPNQVVSVDQLIAGLWGDNPPRRATAALHVYVSQLRKFLARHDSTANPVITRPPGYLIEVGQDDLDLSVVRRLIYQGRSHMRAGDYEQASADFQSALSLWRGPALEDLHEGRIVTDFITWLEELRLECIEMLVESDFMLGRHRELVSFLYTRVAEHPMHEVYYRQLMLALYRCDRRADALQVYQRARVTLSSELGLDPCAALQDMHNAILADDDRLDRQHHLATAV